MHHSSGERGWGCIPPGTKPIHARKSLGELIFGRMHAGPVFALARTQENSFEELLSAYFPNSFGEFILVQIHAAPVFATARVQDKFWQIIYVLVSCQGVSCDTPRDSNFMLATPLYYNPYPLKPYGHLVPLCVRFLSFFVFFALFRPFVSFFVLFCPLGICRFPGDYAILPLLTVPLPLSQPCVQFAPPNSPE